MQREPEVPGFTILPKVALPVAVVVVLSLAGAEMLSSALVRVAETSSPEITGAVGRDTPRPDRTRSIGPATQPMPPPIAPKAQEEPRAEKWFPLFR